jgi:hypothetical protein
MTPKTDIYGLNKEARNVALQEELLKSNTPPPLDPPFPFEPLRFPASVYNVTEYSDGEHVGKV